MIRLEIRQHQQISDTHQNHVRFKADMLRPENANVRDTMLRIHKSSSFHDFAQK